MARQAEDSDLDYCSFGADEKARAWLKNPAVFRASIKPSTSMADVDFSEAKVGLDFSDLFLSGCNFHGCTLRNARFHRTRLENCDFSHADWSGCDFLDAT